jgi:hypothetical protein
MSELSLRARLITPREPRGRTVRAQLGERGLAISDDAGALVPYGALAIEHPHDDELRLGWRRDGEPCELVVEGRDTLAALREKAPAALAERLAAAGPERRVPSRPRRARRIPLALALLLALVAGTMLAIEWMPARLLAALTPSRLESRAGELLTTAILADSGGAEQGDAARALSDLGDRLAECAGARRAIELYLLASPDSDLVVVPGGHVLVPTGAIAGATDARELAHSLARAIVHASRGHALAQAFDQVGRMTMLSLLLGALPEFGESLTRTARRLQGLTYTSAQEEEADQIARSAVAQTDLSEVERDWDTLRLAASGAERKETGEEEEGSREGK